jgi:serine/threonine protein kinase
MLVSTSWVVKIADFGTSRLCSTLSAARDKPYSQEDLDAGSSSTGLDIMTRGVGTLLWSAPEVILAQQYTLSCDVYSFGVVMYEIASRILPFQSLRGPFAVQNAVTSGQREKIPPETPPRMAALTERCWHQDPLQRPTFSECVAELTVIQQSLGGPIPAFTTRSAPVAVVPSSTAASAAATATAALDLQMAVRSPAATGPGALTPHASGAIGINHSGAGNAGLRVGSGLAAPSYSGMHSYGGLSCSFDSNVRMRLPPTPANDRAGAEHLIDGLPGAGGAHVQFAGLSPLPPASSSSSSHAHGGPRFARGANGRGAPRSISTCETEEEPLLQL